MKTVIEMARKVYGQNTEWTDSQLERLKQLEALIRFDEREACAKVCDDLPAPDSCSSVEKSLWDVATLECGDAIRNRNNI